MKEYYKVELKNYKIGYNLRINLVVTSDVVLALGEA